MLLHLSRSQFLSKIHSIEHLIAVFFLHIIEDCYRRSFSFLLLVGEYVPVYSPLPLPLRWKDVACLCLTMEVRMALVS